MKREKILIVDDVEINREILLAILHKDYDIIQAKDGREAIDIVMRNSNEIALILLDIMMPDLDGYKVLEILQNNGFGHIPVIVITAIGPGENEVKGLEAGAVDYISKPFYPQTVSVRVKHQIELRRHRMHLEELVKENVKKYTSVKDSLIDFLASVIEYRDVESGRHVKRTRLMFECLLNRIKESKRMEKEILSCNIDAVLKAVSLHDVGKIGIPDSILLKPARLTKEEFEIIKTHVTIGARIIRDVKDIGDESYLRAFHNICLYHHERWDGKGYPEGRKGADIPFEARVMSIVDIYDALTDVRVYKPAFSHEEAIIEIIKEKDRFDPIIFEIFIENKEDFRKLSKAGNKK